MPHIVDYTVVLKTLTDDGLRCLYHNSGSFGFAENDRAQIVGWIGPEDSSIRPAAREAITHRIGAPYGARLADMLVRALQSSQARTVWVMPGSHWSYELDFGSADWLPEALQNAGISSADLVARNNGAAVEFSSAEFPAMQPLVASLIDRLSGSDFKLVVPHRHIICTVHHHKQLWWQTTDAGVAEQLRAL